MLAIHAIQLAALLITVFWAPAIRAAEPGRGRTAEFEVRFLEQAIDHHFSALRMTELAAGTDVDRDPEISADEGTAPTPETEPTDAKASLDEIRSLARRNNRAQREEILGAQQLLREWYGREHEPQLSAEATAMLAELESAEPGEEFDRLFLESFSQHHFPITLRAVECLASRELRHDALRRMCRNILEAQIVDIDEMRHLLCEEFSVCDFIPATDQTVAGNGGACDDDDHGRSSDENGRRGRRGKSR